MACSPWFLLAFFVSLCLLRDAHRFCNGDPTEGFTAVPLTEWNFEMEKPYDIPLEERYSFVNGVRRMWVYSSDMPLRPDSKTKPRTEIRIRGYDYSSGTWQFEGYGFVPNGTSGTNIMQVHRATYPATTLMLRVYGGLLTNYVWSVVEPYVYDRWMRVNVIHDVDADKLTVFIDGVQKMEVEGNGPGVFNFKCGVYTQNYSTYYMESRWRDIRILKKDE
ncbi:citrate-binding protein-like [Elaeis guineensis]|uniref:Citrate-binding protein n=1 Tax=Elaeis guineensis var. tenera TaxID=51953 RepID=A0A6I9RRW7_ELAGV|nr:citrate-binding protein [Elaeis guineensis]